ncbi:MAG: hypothetical protein ABIK08_04525 [Pseudomonadota bacterium]
MNLRRSKAAERSLPKWLRKSGDKIRCFEIAGTSEIVVVVGAAHRTEAELVRLAREAWIANRLTGTTEGVMQ